MASNDKKQAKHPTCGMCKNCTPLTDFHTLSIKGEPTLGRCPKWTKSKSVLLSLDWCKEIELKPEFSGETETKIEVDEKKMERTEALKKMLEDFTNSKEEIKETLPYGNKKQPKKRTKKA